MVRTRVTNTRKLTFEDAVEVHKMKASGILQTRIASYFNVHSTRIAEIIAGTVHPGSKELAFRKNCSVGSEKANSSPLI